MAALVGQLLFLAMVAALIGGVVWAVVVMRKPRPPLLDEDDEGEWRLGSRRQRRRSRHHLAQADRGMCDG